MPALCKHLTAGICGLLKGNKMSMGLINNLMAVNGARNLNGAFAQLQLNMARLASGHRINSASDDAAGLAVREIMRADVATGRQASRNISDGVSMAQTAEGAAGSISDKLSRMKQLATQASNGTYSDAQKRIMQQEFSQFRDEIGRVAQTTEFNGNKLISSDGQVEISAGDGDMLGVSTKDMSLGSLASLDISSDASAALSAVNSAIEEVSAYRGELGSQMKRLSSAGEVVDIEVENTLAAESRISDTDVAKQRASMASNMVVSQSAIAMQAHSASISRMSLGLL